ncbi:MAG: hypothetical protein ACRDKZ_14290 [Actinomycetota bacterium]
MAGLIAGSLVALVVASLALVFGWVSASGPLVWLSIAASISTALLLALAYSRAKQEALAATKRAARQATRATGRATASMPAARTRQRNSPTDGAVVAVPDRRKYHRTECRYARAKGAERMSRSAARRSGYEACGICKP